MIHLFDSNPTSIKVRNRIWLGLILILALAFRWLGPFLQQSTGDSLHYVALAMKLRIRGMEGYNLQGIDLQTASLNQTSAQHILRLKPASKTNPPASARDHGLQPMEECGCPPKSRKLSGRTGAASPFAQASGDRSAGLSAVVRRTEVDSAGVPQMPWAPQGDLIHDLRQRGLGYYDEPFHHIAYGYPFLLKTFHALSENRPSEGWELVNDSIRPWDLIRLQPMVLASIQWRWIAPSLLSSLGVIFLTYLLGVRFFNEKTGLWAAFLMATHPIDILTSQRIWADDLLSFLCLVCLFCWFRAKDQNSFLWACFSGISLGCAILTKQSALFFGVGGAIAEIIEALQPHGWGLYRFFGGNPPKLNPPSRKATEGYPLNFIHGLTPVVFERRRINLGIPRRISALYESFSQNRKKLGLAMVLFFTTLLVVAHWFGSIWGTYGTPFYNPPLLFTDAPNPWQQLLAHRPSPVILYTIGLTCLSPCTLLGWFQIKESKALWLLIVSAVFSSFFIILNEREYRYLLPILPLLSVAAGSVLARFSARWKAILFVLIMGQILWSLFLTNRYAWQNWGEIMVPF